MRYILSLLLFLSTSIVQGHNILDVDFIQSMTDGNDTAKDIVMYNFKNIKTFKEHYEAKKPSKMQYQETPLIPKVMHQIWVGTSDIPTLYQNYINECKKLHPDWEFKIWRDEEINALDLDYRDLYEKARSYAGKADIARYEILYKFGGVYRDMDVKCLRSINDLNHLYEFYVPIDMPITKWVKWVGRIPLNNGIIGSKPKHTILKRTLDLIRSNFDKNWQDFDQNKGAYSIHDMTIKSSMIPLTDAFTQKATIEDKNVALPSTYFFSLTNYRNRPISLVKKVVHKIVGKSSVTAFHFVRPESLMTHNNIGIKKYEISYCSFDKGNHQNSTKIKRILQSFKPRQARIMQTFRDSYKRNNTKTILYNKTDRMPKVIHFIVFDDKELATLEKQIFLWKMINGDFEIEIWDKSKITEIFRDIDFSLLPKLSEDLRFYTALRILEKYGGTYAFFKAVPHQPIFELNNRYAFYAGLMPLVRSNSQIAFSTKLIGAKPMHRIISRALKEINPYNVNSLKDLNKVLVQEAYKNIELSGPNVILPTVYFEPLSRLKNEPVLDKILRFITRKPKAFSVLTEFTVVE
ncbi:glycosyltransferase [Candidatus Phycorickettsia trachydisci]|nr:glycosyltransferase [Candidatus Phycorickettsia trachydisci]